MNNDRGIAMPFTLFVVITLAVLEIAFLGTSIQGVLSVRRELDRTQSIAAAESSAYTALQLIDGMINGNLNDNIKSTDSTSVVKDAKDAVTKADGISWLVAKLNNAALVQDGCSGSQGCNAVSPGPSSMTRNLLTTVPGSGAHVKYAYRLTMFDQQLNSSQPGGPVTGPIPATGPWTTSGTCATDTWCFPYGYKIEAIGYLISAANDAAGKDTDGNADSVAGRYAVTRLVLNGNITARVQRQTFANYALFTNAQETETGSAVWFTEKTIFYGPVHTNNQFHFANNPSGTFYDEVTQVQAKADFYNNGSPVTLDNSKNGTRDVPVFFKTFKRGADLISTSTSTLEADMKTQALGTASCTDICLPSASGALTNGIYVNGNATLALSVSNDKAVYTVTRTSNGASRVITVDRAAGQTTVLDPATHVTSSYSGLPDGKSNVGTIIFVDGSVSALSGTVQKDTQLTIGAHADVSVTNDIVYTNRTAGSGTPGTADYVPPSVSGTGANLLGIVSWNGNVYISTSSSVQEDIEIDASVMALNGVFKVLNYDSGVYRGQATILGSVITKNYGAFGTFSNGETQTGYGRNFIYDTRMQHWDSPPYFPSTKAYMVATQEKDITDKLVWQELQ